MTDDKKPAPPLKRAPVKAPMSVPSQRHESGRGANNMPTAPAKRVGRRRP